MTERSAIEKAIRPRERVEDAVRDFRAYMEPVFQLYALIHSVSMPSMTIYEDGHIDYKHSAWTVEHLAKCDEFAAKMKEGFPWHEYGLEKPCG